MDFGRFWARPPWPSLSPKTVSAVPLPDAQPLSRMFFLLAIEREVFLDPSMFGKGLVDQLKRKVQSEFEGRVLDSVGFCMCITGWTSTSKGKICDGGLASFTVAFQALFCCPYAGQVIDATVTSVDHIGAQCTAGPVSIFISHHVCYP